MKPSLTTNTPAAAPRNPAPIRKHYPQRSTLDKLTPAQLAEMRDWFLVEDLFYREVQLRLLTRFGVQTSTTTIGAYWHKWISPIITQKAIAKSGYEIEIVIRQGERVLATKTVTTPAL